MILDFTPSDEDSPFETPAFPSDEEIELAERLLREIEDRYLPHEMPDPAGRLRR